MKAAGVDVYVTVELTYPAVLKIVEILYCTVVVLRSELVGDGSVVCTELDVLVATVVDGDPVNKVER